MYVFNEKIGDYVCLGALCLELITREPGWQFTACLQFPAKGARLNWWFLHQKCWFRFNFSYAFLLLAYLLHYPLIFSVVRKILYCLQFIFWKWDFKKCWELEVDSWCWCTEGSPSPQLQPSSIFPIFLGETFQIFSLVCRRGDSSVQSSNQNFIILFLDFIWIIYQPEK